jgi:hypothetical protein
MKEGVFANPLNVSETVFRALKTKMCTYHELNTCIGLEGAMNIIEVWQVADYNEEKLRYIAEQEAELRGKNG